MSKKINRKPYITLSEEVNFLLCSFCKYGEFNCKYGNDCVHPLSTHIKFPQIEDMEPGSDCWGFKPSLSVELTADVVGIMLQKRMGLCVLVERWRPVESIRNEGDIDGKIVQNASRYCSGVSSL